MRNARWCRFLLLALFLLMLPVASFAQVSVGFSVRFGPPALPVYEQPICPGPSYIWAPGYWAWSPDGYYWVPGTWVLAPEPGFLWTPGYWGWGEGFYVWHRGYWGPRVGFYGGINYGYGYDGDGYEGGYWRGRVFYYNRTVNNINVTIIHNTYNRTVVVNNVSRVSYNGGQGGITARPTPAEEAVARERHVPPTPAQIRQQHAASTNRALLASVNHGRPPIAATSRPGVFKGRGVVPARQAGAPFHPMPNRGEPVRSNNRTMRQNENVNRPNNRPQPNMQQNRPQPNRQENRPQPNRRQNKPQPKEKQKKPPQGGPGRPY